MEEKKPTNLVIFRTSGENNEKFLKDSVCSFWVYTLYKLIWREN